MAAILALLEKLVTLLAQFFIYKAGQASVQQAQQQETLDAITKAKRIATDIDRLDADTVRRRLHDWRRHGQ